MVKTIVGTIGIVAIALLIMGAALVQLQPPTFGGWKQVAVQSGQTIWAIGQSRVPGVDPRDVVDAIVDRNHISGAIQPGQTLWVPTKAS